MLVRNLLDVRSTKRSNIKDLPLVSGTPNLLVQQATTKSVRRRRYGRQTILSGVCLRAFAPLSVTISISSLNNIDATPSQAHTYVRSLLPIMDQ